MRVSNARTAYAHVFFSPHISPQDIDMKSWILPLLIVLTFATAARAQRPDGQAPAAGGITSAAVATLSSPNPSRSAARMAVARRAGEVHRATGAAAPVRVGQLRGDLLRKMVSADAKFDP